MGRTKRRNRRGKGIVTTAAKRVIGPEIAMLRVVERKARDLNKRGRATAKERARKGGRKGKGYGSFDFRRWLQRLS